MDYDTLEKEASANMSKSKALSDASNAAEAPGPAGNAQAESSGGWIVLKFGGTSVASAAAWRRILEITNARRQEGWRPLLVCSALAGVSNLLEEAFDKAVAGEEYQSVYRRIVQQHRALCESLRLPLPSQAESLIWKLRKQLVSCSHRLEPNAACKAKVMALGELLASAIGQAWLAAQGCELSWVDARDLLRSRGQGRSARHYLSARCEYGFDADLAHRLEQEAPQGALTQGFIARDAAGETILLGRGGSDTSAACLAAKLGAAWLEIWTDVPGLFSANPHLVPEARLLGSLDYDEAERMAAHGAKVLHPRCLAPLRHYGIPLRVCCTAMPDYQGTAITHAPETRCGVQAILSRGELCHIELERHDAGDDAQLRQAVESLFDAHDIGLTSLQLQPGRLSILIDTRLELPDPERLRQALQQLAPLAAGGKPEQVSSVSLIGHGLDWQGLASELERALPDPGSWSVHAHDDREVTLIASQPELLVQSLHRSLIETRPEADFGPSWLELGAIPSQQAIAS